MGQEMTDGAEVVNMGQEITGGAELGNESNVLQITEEGGTSTHNNYGNKSRPQNHLLFCISFK